LIICAINHAIADGTIFQSNYSREANIKLGMKPSPLETIIYNAPDARVFYKKEYAPNIRDRKVKLISTSWSANPMKGFDVYSWLDKNFDFSLYEYLFVGNSPVPFANIKILPPQPSVIVADLLRNSDIYISASQKDPCSNSLLEALSCGIPTLAIHDGGHPELIQGGGETFHAKEEIPGKVTRILADYQRYVNEIPQRTISETTQQYLVFIEKAAALPEIQKLSMCEVMKIAWLILRYRIQEIL
jgi:glycosyltransferase involved in cell wall biosynthesis